MTKDCFQKSVKAPLLARAVGVPVGHRSGVDWHDDS